MTISNGVTSIGDYAFYGCSGLTSITVPDSVTSIGRDAFRGSRLSQVIITVSDLSAWCTNSISSILGTLGFSDLHLSIDGGEIKEFVIPDDVTSIGASAFYGCGGLTSVTIPSTVTNIGSSAFKWCSGLTSVTIPDGVTSIGPSTFSGCNGLTSVTMPSRLVLASVFTNSYTKIDSVTIPYGSTNIVAGAFKGCSALTSVTIPDTVTSIGDEAFYNCSSLQSLSIPASVTSYGVNCFEGCPAYTLSLYRAIFGGGSGGGSPVVVTTVVQNVEAPYTLTGTAADRAIASVTVNSDCAIDSFVLKDGKVYDSMLYVSNTADHEVTLSLPSGYTYKTIKGARPLTIPASSQCLISITRVAANVFLVMREELDDVQ